ncbi:unnamed protein product [Camellia sinensis]
MYSSMLLEICKMLTKLSARSKTKEVLSTKLSAKPNTKKSCRPSVSAHQKAKRGCRHSGFSRTKIKSKGLPTKHFSKPKDQQELPTKKFSKPKSKISCLQLDLSNPYSQIYEHEHNSSTNTHHYLGVFRLRRNVTNHGHYRTSKGPLLRLENISVASDHNLTSLTNHIIGCKSANTK